MVSQGATPTITITSPAVSSSVSAATIGPFTTGAGLTYNAGTATWSDPTAGTVSAKDFILNGVSLRQILEERLNLMVPNPELEKEWKQLKDLGDAYRKLEADLKEKARIWQALNRKSE